MAAVNGDDVKCIRESKLFDEKWYLEQYPDVKALGMDPVEHYLWVGAAIGRNPAPTFDSAYYLKSNPDVAQSTINPLLHYCRYGIAEGRLARWEPKFSNPYYQKVSKPRYTTRQSSFDHLAERAWITTLENHPACSQAHKRNPLVSIILPTRNRLELLRSAVRSVLEQTYGNFELIIIDDGSSDGTKEEFSRHDDVRIKYLSVDAQNVSVVRNCGLAEAKGEYVAYLDSDDVWLPSYLSLMISEFERSGADTFYAALKVDNGEDRAPFYRARPFEYVDLLQENYISLITFAHRRSVYEALGGFDASLRRMVDWELILRYTAKKKPTFAPFICAVANNAMSRDRVTTSEGSHYKYSIQNRYMIDWGRLSDDMNRRSSGLVSIIVCVFNQRALTDNCIKSVLSETDDPDIELILVDNGSDRDTATLLEYWARRDARVKVVRNEENLNFALGNNVGFAFSRGEHVVFLNNDTVVTKGWLNSLLRGLQRSEIKAVQPRLLHPDGRIQCVGVVFSDKSSIGYPVYYNEPGNAHYVTKSRTYRAITAACMGMRATDFASVQGFDPLYVNGQEDVDLCLRLGRGDKVFLCASDSVVFHHEGKSEGRGRHIEQNRRLFVSRWKDFVVADDCDCYLNDNVDCSEYAPDNLRFVESEIACWRPRALKVADLNEGSDRQARGPISAALVRQIGALKVSIKCPVPKEKEALFWGDYHFARSIERQLNNKGFSTRIDILPDWNCSQSEADDAVLVLRGLSAYNIKPHQLNMCWLISHPEAVKDEELNAYDHVFVASASYTKSLKSRLKVPVSELLQFSDPDIFYPPAPTGISPSEELLFVGNSRKQKRRIISDCLEAGLQVSIYGRDWEGIAPEKLVKEDFIPNEKLHSYYGRADIVLNDHWPDMAEHGFISNRIFDVALSGGLVISDRFRGNEIFEGLVPMYSSSHDLIKQVTALRRDAAKRRDICGRLRELVLRHHTVERRVEIVADVMLSHFAKRGLMTG